MAQMLKKAGEIGLLGGAIPEEYGGSGLDKVSATVLAEKLAGVCIVCSLSRRPCGDRNDPDRLFRHRRAEEEISAQDCDGRVALLLLPFGTAGGFRRLASRTRAVSLAGREELDSQRAENVDHQRRVRGRLHRLRQGGWREILLLHRGAGHAGFLDRRRRKEDGNSRQLDRAVCFSKTHRCRRKTCCMKSGAATSWRSIR